MHRDQRAQDEPQAKQARLEIEQSLSELSKLKQHQTVLASEIDKLKNHKAELNKAIVGDNHFLLLWLTMTDALSKFAP